MVGLHDRRDVEDATFRKVLEDRPVLVRVGHRRLSPP